MQAYDIPNAMNAILPFVDDASNWYVRRSRKRFWKSDNDQDKNAAYRTLHYVLVRLSVVMAPFTPFLAEELYQKLTGGESVHLVDWPEVGHINELVIARMTAIRHLITVGLSVRADKGIKVRQPLAKATIRWTYKDFPEELLEITREELNVKEVAVDNRELKPDKTFLENFQEDNFKQLYQIELNTKLTPELKREGMVREVIRFVQNARKDAGLEVNDRICLQLTTDDKDLQRAITEGAEQIKTETLAHELGKEVKDHESSVRVGGADLQIGLAKAKK
jgi:isoleucyl-tRNA synthetase